MNTSPTAAPIDVDCATSLFFLLQAFDQNPYWKPGGLGFGFDSIVPEIMRYATAASPLTTFFHSLNWDECGGVFNYEVPEAAAQLFAEAITESGSIPTADDVVEMFRKSIAADTNFAGMLSPSPLQPHDTYNVGSWALPAIFNGDRTYLTDDDAAALDGWLDDLQNTHGDHTLTADVETGFSNCQISGLGAYCTRIHLYTTGSAS